MTTGEQIAKAFSDDKHHLSDAEQRRLAGMIDGKTSVTIRHVEPGEDGRTTLVSVTLTHALQQARASLQQAKPDMVDPRSDLEAVEDYMIVHWAGVHVGPVRGDGADPVERMAEKDD